MTRYIVLIATLLAILAAAAVDASAAARMPAKAPTIRVEHDQQKFVTKVGIRSTDGNVAWSDVLLGLARARGYDDKALAGVLPDVSFNLGAVGWRLLRTALNLSLAPDIRIDVQRPAAGGDPWLVITMDEAALLESQRKFTKRLRGAILRTGRQKRTTYGLALKSGWHRAPAGKDLVITVHGLNSEPEAMEPLLAGPRKDGFPCGAFRYPNDQSIDESGKMLAAELGRLAHKHPRRRIALVTHSMGGLVARVAVEDPALDPGNVWRLVMIAPPNQGSLLAHFAYGLDLSEHVRDRQRKKQAGIFYALVEDGLSEAYTDLKPGSVFLTRLNARRRNPGIRYTIFLGASTPIKDEDLAALRRSLANPANRWVRFFGSKVRDWINDMDEVVDGRGDGAVAVKRGRLAGVPDTHVLKFNHISVLHKPGHDPDLIKLHKMLLARLRGEAP